MFYAGLTNIMFLAAKISAHIKLLEQRKTKISAYLESVRSGLPENPLHVSMMDRKRIMDIEQSLLRIDNQISQYQTKLDHINSLQK